jgi:hypothetical protein
MLDSEALLSRHRRIMIDATEAVTRSRETILRSRQLIERSRTNITDAAVPLKQHTRNPNAPAGRRDRQDRNSPD